MGAGPDDERAAIMRGARIVLRRSGFEGLKVQLVLRETGLSARSFYRHFPDKESLLVALIQDEYAATARRLARATAAVDDPEAKVSAWIRELLLGTSDPALEPRTRLFTTHYLAMSRFPDAALQSNRLVIQPLAEAIARGQQLGMFQGSDPANDAIQTARLVGGTLNELLAQAPGPTPVDHVVDATTDFVLRALRVPSTFDRKPK
jgi:AcrR family transcriptional regulator